MTHTTYANKKLNISNYKLLIWIHNVNTAI